MIEWLAAGGVLLLLASKKAQAAGAAPPPQVSAPGVPALASQTTAIAGGAVSGAALGLQIGGPIGAAVGFLAGGSLSFAINDEARHSAARKGWAAVQDGINQWIAYLKAQGVTDTDTLNYVAHTWGADFGIRGRNGLPPWPGKVPVSNSGIIAAERIRDAAKASLRRRGVGVPDVALVTGQIVPGEPPLIHPDQG
jgi:hypothetical protein